MTSARQPREFSPAGRRITRREFSVDSARALAGLILPRPQESITEEPSSVALARNPDRSTALKTVLELIGEQDFRDKTVYLKASFNSGDPFPATTDLETLHGVARYLRESNCGKLVLVERSGMRTTRNVWEKLGVPPLAKKLEITLLALEDLPPGDWRQETLSGSHWTRGVEIPAFVTSEACIVQLSNLKTHRFGGHFSASLKNSVGLISKYSQTGARHNYMNELHASPDQRAMIAEINQIYSPSLIVMDAERAFIDGGPENGDLAYPEVMVASKDRIAVDAVGVALLRLHGVVGPTAKGSVFEQAQIKRAAEMKLGARSPKEIKLLTLDDPGRKLASQIYAVLEKTEDSKKS